MTSRPELSIIIPAYNEEKRLPASLERILAYLDKRPTRAEIIVVNDGSADGTAGVVQQFQQRYPELRLLSNERNRGKGFSVRTGMLEARGELALFTDADLSTPIDEVDKLLAAIREQGYDGAIGSRALDRSLIEVHESRFRELAGVIFNRLVRLITGMPFADTQCGFKAFQREKGRIVFEQQRTEGFGFDPEILFLARRHGLKVAEIPVHWKYDAATKVRMVSDSLGMFAELVAIRCNAWMGRYPRKPAGQCAAARTG